MIALLHSLCHLNRWMAPRHAAIIMGYEDVVGAQQGPYHTAHDQRTLKCLAYPPYIQHKHRRSRHNWRKMHPVCTLVVTTEATTTTSMYHSLRTRAGGHHIKATAANLHHPPRRRGSCAPWRPHQYLNYNSHQHPTVPVFPDSYPRRHHGHTTIVTRCFTASPHIAGNQNCSTRRFQGKTIYTLLCYPKHVRPLISVCKQVIFDLRYVIV